MYKRSLASIVISCIYVVTLYFMVCLWDSDFNQVFGLPFSVICLILWLFFVSCVFIGPASCIGTIEYLFYLNKMDTFADTIASFDCLGVNFTFIDGVSLIKKAELFCFGSVMIVSWSKEGVAK